MWWEQIIAAIVAAVVPFGIKWLTDIHNAALERADGGHGRHTQHNHPPPYNYEDEPPGPLL